jgi:hypothetical protein
MSVEAPTTPGVEELRELYLRYKGLVFGATARILLKEPVRMLVVDAGALLEDCRTSARVCEAPLRVQFNACERAAVELREMLAEAGEAGEASVGSARLGSVRASHSHLRREIWKSIPCEYVPCAAAVSHAPEQ